MFSFSLKTEICNTSHTLYSPMLQIELYLVKHINTIRVNISYIPQAPVLESIY